MEGKETYHLIVTNRVKERLNFLRYKLKTTIVFIILEALYDYFEKEKIDKELRAVGLEVKLHERTSDTTRKTT
jgi:hypothetical protein